MSDNGASNSPAPSGMRVRRGVKGRREETLLDLCGGGSREGLRACLEFISLTDVIWFCLIPRSVFEAVFLVYFDVLFVIFVVDLSVAI